MKSGVLSTKAHDELQQIISLEKELEYIETKAKFILKKKKEGILKILEETK